MPSQEPHNFLVEPTTPFEFGGYEDAENLTYLGLDGEEYEMFLTDEALRHLRVILEPYIAVARVVLDASTEPSAPDSHS